MFLKSAGFSTLRSQLQIASNKAKTKAAFFGSKTFPTSRLTQATENQRLPKADELFNVVLYHDGSPHSETSKLQPLLKTEVSHFAETSQAFVTLELVAAPLACGLPGRLLFAFAAVQHDDCASIRSHILWKLLPSMFTVREKAANTGRFEPLGV